MKSTSLTIQIIKYIILIDKLFPDLFLNYQQSYNDYH